MSGTWSVSRAGEERGLSGYTQEEAEQQVAELPAQLDEPGSVFIAHDLLPELEQRFPEGGEVWLTVHWRRGQHGTVGTGEPESFAKWVPRPGPVPWFIGESGAEVFVALDDGYASWWPTRWLDTR